MSSVSPRCRGCGKVRGTHELTLVAPGREREMHLANRPESAALRWKFRVGNPVQKRGPRARKRLFHWLYRVINP